MSSTQRTEAEFAEQLGSAVTGSLNFLSGASDLELRGDWLTGDLYRAHFSGHVPEIRSTNGTVTVRYPPRPLSRRKRAGEMTLNASVSWAIEIQGGGAHINADLTHVRLRSFDLQRGASEVLLTLDRPSGTVRLSFGGGINNVTIRRPAGVPALVRVGRGTSGIALDGQQLGAVGGPVQLVTPGYEDAEDRYEVLVNGGANNLLVQSR